MKNTLKILSFFLVSLLANFSFGKESSNGLSDGTLVLETKENPVKVFVNPYISDVSNVLGQNNNEVLIILNKLNTEARNQEEINYLIGYYNDLKSQGFILLDKAFKPVSENTNLIDYKYILKSKRLKVNDFEKESAYLETKYKIWDPKEGIEILGFNLRFYGLMFVIAFGLGLLIMKYMFKIDGVEEKYLDPLFTWTLFGTIFGARIGHVLFYDAHLFVEDFWSVFLPIRTKPYFEFTGFAGLASHGAAIALILTTLYYSLKIIKKNPLWVYDRLGIVVALAGFFIRMGNFFNSEIIGKPAREDSFWAVLFPQQSVDYGIIVPRYPTQLIEALGYLSLFFVLFVLYRFTNKKYQQGWLFGLFFVVLWSIRFFTEFLKEPQGEEYISFLGLNTGQILSLPFIILGAGIMLYSRKNNVIK